MAGVEDQDEQALLLEEAFGFAAEQRFYLRKAIQQNDLEMALRYGICLTSELRSSKLLPEKYYQLYALVFWELQHLAAFAGRADRHGLQLSEIYEMVQYEGNVLPRLYLLVTVGAVYMHQAGKAAVAKNILGDLSQMLSAVQHPMRGLFLRYYLLQMAKDKLALLESTRDALQYLLSNLREAVSLWSRLRLSDKAPTAVDTSCEASANGRRRIAGGFSGEASGEPGEAEPVEAAAAQRPSRGGSADSAGEGGRSSGVARLPSPSGGEGLASASSAGAGAPVGDADHALSEALRLDRSRHALRFLVGAHLMHIARLESLSLELYSELVLPEVLRISNTCEDAAGQAYLLECFVEVFPDRFHLGTLDVILAASGQVHWVVDLRPLLQHLLQRLTKHVKELDDGDRPAADAFSVFHAHLLKLYERPRSPATPLASLLALQLELSMSSLTLHAGDADRAELVLRGAVKLLSQREAEPLDAASRTAVVDILAAPLTQESLVPAVLAMAHHATLMGHLSRVAQREAALAMLAAILQGDVSLGDCVTVRQLLTLADRLIRDEGGEEGGGHGGVVATMRHLEHDPEAFTEEQELVARVVHQVRHPDPEVVFKMLLAMRGYFNQGGPHRLVFTVPAMVVATLRLAGRIGGAHAGQRPSPEELFEFAHNTCASLGSLAPQESLRLWLLCASAAEKADWGIQVTKMGPACSRFVESGLLCLERDIMDSHVRLRGLQLLVGTLRQATCLDGFSYGLAADRAVRIGSGLSAKRIQSRALCLCAGLFWCPARHEAPSALKCLRQALKLADAAVHIDPVAIDLFVEVLDHAAHLFGEGSREVSAPLLSSLLALCVQHIRYVESRVPAEALRALHAAVEDLRVKQAEALEALDKARSSEEACAVSRHADLRLELDSLPRALEAPAMASEAVLA